MTEPFRIVGNTVWPVPCSRTSDLEHRLRYAERGAIFSMEDRLIAASFIAAYGNLIFKPIDRRNKIIRELRKGPGNDSKGDAANA